MNGYELRNGAGLYLEVAQGSLRILKGEAGLQLPLERLENGRLAEPCKERVIAAVQSFLKRPAWQPRLRAMCAINARGVSLRQISLPAAGKEELKRLLLLQIEGEFPLAPDELAWGYQQLETRDGATGRQTLLIAAVKKEVLEQYAELLAACGITPVFALAALARSFLCSPLQGSYAMLEVGRSQAELTDFENRAAVSVRVLPWGGENFSQALVPAQFLDALAAALRNERAGRKLYLTGEGIRERAVAQHLAEGLADFADCERIETAGGDGMSPAILGLKKAVEKDGGATLLAMQLKPAQGNGRAVQPAVVKWGIRAAALLLAVLVFPYAEALVMKPRLAKKIADLENSRGRLVMIDRELSFLEYLKTNQPPYLDAVYLMASVAVPGTKIESVSMNRRGEVSIKGTMQNSQQVGDFRAKLISSGFYANVVVEEQTPSPDRQKVTVRMTAQWKPEAAREMLALGPPPEEFEKLRTAAKEARFAQPMMMGNPFPMPMPGPFAGPPPMAMHGALSGRPAAKPPGASSRRVALPPGATGPVVISGPEGGN